MVINLTQDDIDKGGRIGSVFNNPLSRACRRAFGYDLISVYPKYEEIDNKGLIKIYDTEIDIIDEQKMLFKTYDKEELVLAHQYEMPPKMQQCLIDWQDGKMIYPQKFDLRGYEYF